MGVNIGHGDKRVIDAIAKQGETLPYISPFMAFETRARLGEKLASLWPGDLEKSFFTLGGAEANENAIRIAKAYTGRQKILTRYRSYHGATYATINLTGDPRRWANENPPMPGVVRVLDPYHGTAARRPRTRRPRWRSLRETIELEGPETIAAFILETVTGTNGILIPPDGYLQGVRDLCTEFGIVMIADEVMCGFGRTGEWFAVNHWDVVPDLMSTAKGLTSSYLPLGALAISPEIAAHFDEHVFWGGLTYNSHPLSCAAALAAIEVMEQDDLVGNAKRMGEVMARHHAELADKHPSVGRVRNLGLFGVLELVKDRDDDGAALAVQRAERDDAEGEPSAAGPRPVHDGAVQPRDDEPAALRSPRSSSARASRSSTRCSRSPTRRWGRRGRDDRRAPRDVARRCGRGPRRVRLRPVPRGDLEPGRSR